MRTNTGLTLPSNTTIARTQDDGQITTVLLLLCLGLLGIAVGLAIAILFPTGAEIATLS